MTNKTVKIVTQDISILHLPIGIFKIDNKKKIVYVNPYFCKISGYTEFQLLGIDWLRVTHPADRQAFISPLIKSMRAGNPYKFEFRFINDKHEKWVLCDIVPESAALPNSYFIGTITDISELKHTQAALQKLARFDPLTKLPNRYLFEDLLTKSLLRSDRNKNTLALFYIDLDYFKNVNDMFGHEVGDKFLAEAGRRLKQNVREEDFIVRLGGDEFAVIFEDILTISAISIAAQRLIDSFKKPFLVGKTEINCSLSIGISVYPEEATTSETIVQQADQALYQAKTSGRNCYKYYNKTMQVKLERYMLIVEQLRNAIQENQFELYYQPQIDVKNWCMVGMEALIRFNNPNIQTFPSEFISIAEESGLMTKIGDWVIENALNQYKHWYTQSEIMKNVVISVNISPTQLNDSSIIETITKILKKTEIPTRNILFELTETAVMKKAFDTTSLLQVFLSELGIGISIDDFGTGYSSLTYLKQLPVKELKIDKSFIDDIGKNVNSELIIKAIINLALILDLKVIAEGVETKDQVDFLTINHCTVIQGYYFSKPLNVIDMTTYIAAMPYHCEKK